MYRKIKIFFIVLLYIVTLSVSMAQNRTVDSLQSVLRKLNSPNSSEFNPTIEGRSAGQVYDTILINALNDLAWEIKKNNPDTAIILSKQALQLAQENKWQKGEGISYLNLGAFNCLKGNPFLALDYDFKALALWEQLLSTDSNPKSIILKNKAATIGNIGAIYQNLGNYPQALNYYFKALKMAEESGNKNLIATWVGNIGTVYFSQDDCPKALGYYSKALKMAEELKNKNKIALNLGNIGTVYAMKADYLKALDYYCEALKIKEELGNKSEIAKSLGNIGIIYKYLGDSAYSNGNKRLALDDIYPKALNYYFRALKQDEDFGDKMGIAFQLENIGGIYFAIKNYKKAEEYLKRALALVTEINALDMIRSNQQDLSILYEQTQQPAKALEHYKKYIEARDSIFNEENTKKTLRSEMSFEFDKKQTITKAEQDKQNAIALEEKQKQKITLILVSGFLLLVLVFAGFMFNRWRITQQQKKIIEKQKEKIIDSISYAQLIQQSILMEESEIQKYLPDSFIYYQPKDIVSGDFYWFSEVVGSSELVVGSKKENDPNFSNNELQTTNYKLIIAAIDCTGHGVPGAFMSMIGNTLLNQIVNEKQITTPSEILRLLNIGVFEALHQQKDGALSLDGMDISLCYIDYKKNELQYAGAQNPLYILADNRITVINASNQTIGGKGLSTLKEKDSSKTEYTNHIVQIKKGMSIYLFTDGYMDQFGLPDKASVVKGTSYAKASDAKGKKFGIQKFKELLLNNQHLSMQQQKKLIDAALENWKVNIPQTDDVLVMGIRL